ncbi:MAG: S-methyl-5-thioribose-1-phosphate isomerase [Candidatus Eremiobacteraeota bacterium]|nr:S-methyl-5-thioribose-1-phosphate isomerase [Candidatus Eremiobacteraeota bacterium]
MKSIDWKDGHVVIIDQRKLPHEEVLIEIDNLDDLCDSIKTLAVRGAPALGIAAAMGMALAAQNSRAESREKILSELEDAAKKIRNTRPTAINLFWGIERAIRAAQKVQTPEEIKKSVLDMAIEVAKEDEELCRAIGKHGAALVPQRASILTHCNAGGLATGGYGTALGVIRSAYEEGKNIMVWVDETRPLLQGARLTTWELKKAGIPFKLITDNMAAHFMQRGMVDLVITGADRITSSGDTANKIGTYALAVLAKYHDIPFYIAAPFSTIDFSIEDGREIPIEERAGDEVRNFRSEKVAPSECDTANPAFDVTPCDLITAIITERGIVKPPFKENLAKLYLAKTNKQ